jgi:hypothetical protein
MKINKLYLLNEAAPADAVLPITGWQPELCAALPVSHVHQDRILVDYASLPRGDQAEQQIPDPLRQPLNRYSRNPMADEDLADNNAGRTPEAYSFSSERAALTFSSIST